MIMYGLIQPRFTRPVVPVIASEAPPREPHTMDGSAPNTWGQLVLKLAKQGSRLVVAQHDSHCWLDTIYKPLLLC
jgi:hypothetical protein